MSVTHHDTSLNNSDTIRCWVGIAALMKRGNEVLFPSRDRTREIIMSGEYIRVLRDVNPLLYEWKQDFDKAKREFRTFHM